MRQKEYFGFNSIKNLKDILNKSNVKNIFLVSGKNSYELCGAKKKLSDLLANYDVTTFYDFRKNPKLTEIEKGINIYLKKKYDIMIAVGGGSVIDTAKLINIFSAQIGKPLEYIMEKRKIDRKGKPLVAIPTTAGSGSEATHFAVVYLGKKKYSVAHKNILPDFSIIDPTFTLSLPKYITASSGIDTLSQAIESYWCINSTNKSKRYAKEAIQLVMENLSNAVNNPTKKSRYGMIKAANLAGKAINITKTTAPHAISYIFTSFFDIPHGHAVGLTLGKFLVYNSKVNKNDVSDKRGVAYVKKSMYELYKILYASNAESAKNRIDSLIKEIGLEVDLYKLGIKTKNDIELIVNNINLERLANNPRKITKSRLKGLLLNYK